MESLTLFGRCIFLLVASIIISSAVIQLNFINQYNSLERNEFRKQFSLGQRLSVFYLKKIALKCGGYARVSYSVIIISWILIILECVVFFFENSIALWTIVENISVGYIYFTLLINSPTVLASSSSADTTDRDFKAEYSSALQKVERLQISGDCNLHELKQCVLRLQQKEYQYYRWLNHHRGAEYSTEQEKEIQALYRYFIMVEDMERNGSDISFENSFCIKNMFFVKVQVYNVEFKNAIENKTLEDAIRIIDLFIKKIGTVHDWNTDIGRDDLTELQKNCESWFALIHQIEQIIIQRGDMTQRRQLLEIYNDASTSLITATVDLRREVKVRRKKWKQYIDAEKYNQRSK